MALASTAAAQLRYLKEDSYGSIPTGTPKKLRMTGEDLKFEVQSETSKEINSSRQVSNSLQVGAEASGNINLELSYAEYDPFIEGVLASSFTVFGTGGVKAINITSDSTANTISDADLLGSFSGLSAGQWISVSGGTAIDGIYRIASLTADVLTIDSATPVATTISTAVSASVSSSRIANSASTALQSFSIEKAFTDVNQYFMFVGMVANSLDLNFATAQIVTGTVGFIGKGSSRAAATQFPGGAPSASQAYEAMNAVDGLGAVSGGIGGILLRDSSSNDLLSSTFIQSMKISIDAKARGQKAIGVKGNAGVALGTFSITGTIDVYLADGSVYDEALADNLVSLSFPVHDGNNNGYAISLENCKLGVPTVVAGSMDSDVMLSIPVTAVAPDTSTDKMIYIDRFGAAV